MKIGIVVGETSGDKLAANLLKNIIKNNPKIILLGVIGPELKKLGCIEILSMNDLNTFGIIEPLFKIHKLIKFKKILLTKFINNIDIFIGIDFPGFNLIIEKILKKNGIFTFHIVSPSIWAWRSYRINNIKKAVNIIMLLYKFEKFIYNEKKIPYQFIGHPFSKKSLIRRANNIIKLRFKINIKHVIISLLPGSRNNEIKYHIDIYKKLICQYKNQENFIFITTVNNKKYYNFIKKIYNKYTNSKVILNNFDNLLVISDFIVVASGTASLESALYKKIVIIIYKLNYVIFKLLKNFIKLKHISLPNIICKQNIFNEYIQDEFNINNISNEIVKYRNKILLRKNIYNINKLFKTLNNNTQLHFEKIFNNFLLNK